MFSKLRPGRCFTVSFYAFCACRTYCLLIAVNFVVSTSGTDCPEQIISKTTLLLFLLLLLLLLSWRAWPKTMYTPLLNHDPHWFHVPECIAYKRCILVYKSSWHGAELLTRCHSACCWSNVVQSTAVCIVIRSCGASNTSFNAWRPSLRGCWTTRMEQFTWFHHWLLDTSHLQEISQDLGLLI